jgi:MAM domain, meprin/A5/mu/Somatomedin B domain
VSFFCHTGYVAAGNRNAYCNGTDWDRALGICRETHIGPQLSCDFETDDICGWTHIDFDWQRRNGYTRNELRTGPMHDHTSMKPLEGFYMLSESELKRENDKARMISPTFATENSVNACFRLFYHMYGTLVGRLAVYVKPVSKRMAEILDEPKYKFFNVTGNQGKVWKEAYFTIDQFDEEFQIVIEASSGMELWTDIAIDDVALMTGADCTNEQFQSTTPKVKKTESVFHVQTCKDRCRETKSMVTNETDVITDGVGRNGQVFYCDCFPGCGELKTCCPDYLVVCSAEDGDDMSTTPDTYATAPAISPVPTTSATATLVLATTTPLMIERDIKIIEKEGKKPLKEKFD